MTTLCWILWFTISTGHNQILHIPIEETFGSLKECKARGNAHWTPLLEQQFPKDPALSLSCKPCALSKGV